MLVLGVAGSDALRGIRCSFRSLFEANGLCVQSIDLVRVCRDVQLGIPTVHEILYVTGFCRGCSLRWLHLEGARFLRQISGGKPKLSGIHQLAVATPKTYVQSMLRYHICPRCID